MRGGLHPARGGRDSRAALPLWIPAFAGMTRGGRGPSTGSGRTESRNGPTVMHGVRFSLGGPAVSIPRPGARSPFGFPQGERTRPAPLDSCFRRNDALGARGCRKTWKPRAAPLPWIPAFAGTTRGRSAFSACSERGFPPLHRPSGYRLSPVRRGGGRVTFAPCV